ncbi:unnamed protein product [Didymodactylos carnosus]|uniref:Uncharacterized protein n=1 Tax=Didymodactylos carnosus TaxID=1234261 RepID=A0A814RSV3_9BILA|nr:unnamed protein product [Didymodactylos carnosus]CAF1136867.1 unnamed protein product [Didymodactylos carnosus]CAF3697540.1 unnamed protein product [Didymodactylos carnosus]CAF3900596.1 unnamed protein product [Didymodactylos carnosus]
MASSNSPLSKSKPMTKISSHTVYTATSKDYDRMKVAQKHENKLELEYERLERKLMSKAKWNERADQSVIIKSTTASSANGDLSVDDWLQREREKAQNMNKSKELANQRIRCSPFSGMTKPSGGTSTTAAHSISHVRKVSPTTATTSTAV